MCLYARILDGTLREASTARMPVALAINIRRAAGTPAQGWFRDGVAWKANKTDTLASSLYPTSRPRGSSICPPQPKRPAMGGRGGDAPSLP